MKLLPSRTNFLILLALTHSVQGMNQDNSWKSLAKKTAGHIIPRAVAGLSLAGVSALNELDIMNHQCKELDNGSMQCTPTGAGYPAEPQTFDSYSDARNEYFKNIPIAVMLGGCFLEVAYRIVKSSPEKPPHQE